MSWPIFAIIQLALTTVGVGLVLWLRNRELRARLEQQERAAAEAAEVIREATARYEVVHQEARDKWLDDRAMEFDEDDPVQRVQKLVLQNEKESIPDFDDGLRRRIASGDEAHEHYREEWRKLRTEAYQSATDLIERFPRSHPVIVQLFDSLGVLDDEYGVELPSLPEPAEPASDDDGGALEITEHLRAANELLHQQLEDTRTELEEARSAGKAAEEQEEDLKALLQQFTRDSRDMMACIQELERENQQLREQLGVSSAEDGGGQHHAA